MPPAQLTLGTGLLSGRTSPIRARRIVDAAVAAGITRFDTARAYGDGETERFLGSVLRRRPDVTVVTKVGLGPVRRRPVSAVRWRTASHVVGLLPGGGAGTAAFGDEESDPDPRTRFDEGFIRASLDESRRALHRERLDLVLLHEFDDRADGAAAAEVMDALVAEDVIGAWGVGTRRAALRRLVGAGTRLGSLVQTTGGPLLPVPPRPTAPAPQLSVHSVLGPGGSLLNAFLEWLPTSGQGPVWERLVGPLEARRTAGTALLRAAVADAATANVLVSSRDPESLTRTVAAVRSGETPERLAQLAPVFQAFVGRRSG